MAAVFMVNIGANSSHSARARIQPDGSFDFLPIPEETSGAAPMLRYADIPALARSAPASWLARSVHCDPDFYAPSPTYGDNCARIPRAFALRRAQPGDTIVFIARLTDAKGSPGFYLVGRLEVASSLRDVTADPGPGWWDANAHVRRGRALGRWDGFTVFAGGSDSGLLAQAVPFSRKQARAVFGPGWEWPASQTDLQVIGAHTRSVRRLEGEPAQRLRALAGGPLRQLASTVPNLSPQL